MGVQPVGKVAVDTDPNTNGNQATLMFSAMDWNTAQTVEAKGLDDADRVDATRTQAHTVIATGGGLPLCYTLTPSELPVGLTYILPATDGDAAELSFAVRVADDSMLTFPRVPEGGRRQRAAEVHVDGPAPPPGLNYTPPTVEDGHGGTLNGAPTEVQPPTPYRLTATHVDGDMATLTFRVAIVQVKARVTIADATAEEGAPVHPGDGVPGVGGPVDDGVGCGGTRQCDARGGLCRV